MMARTAEGRAKDGLLARNNGPWARDKLSFLDEFIPPALKATERKKDRIYIDLFAGPGKNVDESTGQEFDGSALRALTLASPGSRKTTFDRAELVNLYKADHLALTARVDHLAAQGLLQTSRKRVELLNGDANLLIHRLMKSIDTRAYVFVIADIEAPKQLKWDTVRALKQHGHGSVDAFILFPLDMALNRMLSYQTQAREQSAEVLTSFFGSEEWRDLAEERITDAQSPSLRRAVLGLYKSRLQGLGWKHVLIVRDVKRTGQSGLYKMIYASNHPAGESIAKWSADQPRKRNQIEMF